MNFTFPPTKFVEDNTLSDQIDHLFGECVEVVEAETEEERHLEIVDAYHSAETALRIIARDHGEEYLEALVARVIGKNESRSYYRKKYACTVFSIQTIPTCVMDEGRAWSCSIGRELDHKGKAKEACPHWREI